LVKLLKYAIWHILFIHEQYFLKRRIMPFSTVYMCRKSCDEFILTKIFRYIYVNLGNFFVFCFRKIQPTSLLNSTILSSSFFSRFFVVIFFALFLCFSLCAYTHFCTNLLLLFRLSAFQSTRMHLLVGGRDQLFVRKKNSYLGLCIC
jgi:hypothetical protein